MKTGILYGLIGSAFGLLWLWLEFAVGLHTQFAEFHPIATNFVLIPYIFLFRSLLVAKRNSMGGTITFGQGFREGMVMTLVMTAFAPLNQYVFHQWINPDFFETFRQLAVADHHTSPEQAAAYFNPRSYRIQATLGTFGFGSVISIISSLFMKSKST